MRAFCTYHSCSASHSIVEHLVINAGCFVNVFACTISPNRTLTEPSRLSTIVLKKIAYFLMCPPFFFYLFSYKILQTLESRHDPRFPTKTLRMCIIIIILSCMRTRTLIARILNMGIVALRLHLFMYSCIVGGENNSIR